MRSGLNIPMGKSRISMERTFVQRSGLFALALLVGLVPLAYSQQMATGITEKQDEPLDRVVAVVDNQVILASDVELEGRIFYLLPINDPRDSTPAKALERLTTRALIEQQILQEDPHGLEIAPKDVEDSLAELRQALPACKQRDCASVAGWSAYLATLGLTPERVDVYWRNRMAVLRFIEQRFRSGIRITPEEIRKYYKETLLPKYAKPEDAPPLDRLSPRIQEILLQQEVNALLNDWLKSLQDQGQVEVLDPSLRSAVTVSPADIEPPNSGPSIPLKSLPQPPSGGDAPPAPDEQVLQQRKGGRS
jgi:peptidyl-prolyl cis-trans isomerase SurA